MRRILLTLLCAVTAMAGMADGVQVSLQRLMRERGLTPADNRLASEPDPSRPKVRIAAVEAYGFENDETSGLLVVDSVACPLGWSMTLTQTDSMTVAKDFWGVFDLQYVMQDDSTVIIPYGMWSDCYEVLGAARNRIDTVSYACAVPLEWLCGQDTDPDATGLQGQVYADGSMAFDGAFAMCVEMVTRTYKNGRLMSTDTTWTLSPIFNNLMLLMPNGYDTYTNQLSNFGVNLHVTTKDGNVMSPDDYPNESTGFGGKVSRPVNPRPIKPKVEDPFVVAWSKSLPGSFNGDVHFINLDSLALSAFDAIWPGQCFPDGHGGYVGRPIDPRPIKPKDNARLPYSGTVGGNPSITGTLPGKNHPVYIFQSDDSTLLVYNMMGYGYVPNVMTLHPDSTMTYPMQVLGWNDEQAAPIYNCTETSLSDTTLMAGCSGTVTPSLIEWPGMTAYCPANGAITSYGKCQLMLTNGSQFVIPEAPLTGDVDGDGILGIADVTALIDVLLQGGTGAMNTATTDLDHDGVVGIADLTALIDRLLSPAAQR